MGIVTSTFFLVGELNLSSIIHHRFPELYLKESLKIEILVVLKGKLSYVMVGSLSYCCRLYVSITAVYLLHFNFYEIK